MTKAATTRASKLAMTTMRVAVRDRFPPNARTSWVTPASESRNAIGAEGMNGECGGGNPVGPALGCGQLGPLPKAIGVSIGAGGCE